MLFVNGNKMKEAVAAIREALMELAYAKEQEAGTSARTSERMLIQWAQTRIDEVAGLANDLRDAAQAGLTGAVVTKESTEMVAEAGRAFTYATAIASQAKRGQTAYREMVDMMNKFNDEDFYPAATFDVIITKVNILENAINVMERDALTLANLLSMASPAKPTLPSGESLRVTVK